MTEYLFIGGPHDGTWHEVKKHPHSDGTPLPTWTLAVMPALSVVQPENISDVTMKTATYWAQSWQASKDDLRWVFAFNNMKPGAVLTMLLEGYRGLPENVDSSR